MVGVTGDGKSTAGNTLAGGEKTHFKESSKFVSEVQSCQCADGNSEVGALRIIDTRGLCDTRLANSEALEQFNRFADKAHEGVHVFLFIVRAGRFKPEHDQTLTAFAQNCGQTVLRQTAIVFTHWDGTQAELERSASQCPELKRWLSQVGYYVGVDLKDPSDAPKQVLEQAVRKILEKTHGEPYANASLKAAQEWREATRARAHSLPSWKRQQALKAIADVADGRSSRDDATKLMKQLEYGEKHLPPIVDKAAEQHMVAPMRQTEYGPGLCVLVRLVMGSLLAAPSRTPKD